MKQKSIQIGTVSIPLDSYTVGGTALLGIRESGKTFAAKGIAEQLLEHGVPLVIFDAIGVWRYLKTPGSGPRARGYEIVVAGGNEPDLPLTPQSAPEIVRAAIGENISIVFDLYDRKLSKADWRRIVQACFRTLLFENEGLRHIILEESAEFIPQKVMDGETFAEVEKVVRMGGNRSLGITLINQRAQEVNKSVLDLCENLVLMRQRGAHAIDSLERWMDRISPDQAKQIARELPSLQQGDCWVFDGAADAPARTKTNLIRSFHPDRRKPQLTAKAKDAQVDTSKFIRAMNDALPRLAEECKANDPAELKKRIRDLERELNRLEQVAPSSEDVITAEKGGYDRGFNDGANHAYRRGWDEHADAVSNAIASIPNNPPVIGDARPENPVRSALGPSRPAVAAPRAEPNRTRADGARARQIDGRASSRPGGEQLPKAERAFLTVLAQRRDQGKRTTRNQVAIFAGYSVTSRHIDNTLATLRSSQLVVGGGDNIQITDAGLAALGTYDPMPTGADLRAYWLREAGGKAEREMLQVVLDAHPRILTRQEIAERSGYSVGSRHVDNTLARLRSLELIQGPGSAVRASEDLFS